MNGPRWNKKSIVMAHVRWWGGWLARGIYCKRIPGLTEIKKLAASFKDVIVPKPGVGEISGGPFQKARNHIPSDMMVSQMLHHIVP